MQPEDSYFISKSNVVSFDDPETTARPPSFVCGGFGGGGDRLYIAYIDGMATANGGDAPARPSWEMSWHSVAIDDAAAANLSAVERLCACPILSAPRAQADAAAAEATARMAEAVALLAGRSAKKADSSEEEAAAAPAAATAASGDGSEEKSRADGGESKEAVEEAAAAALARANLSVREWYLEVANEPLPEEPIVREAVDRIRTMRRFEESCGAFLGDVRYVLALLERIEEQHQQVRACVRACLCFCLAVRSVVNF